MPVHNAMPHLPAALDSVLAQTFRDFELFIGDDCSDDGALECIRNYAAWDSRIRYARSDTRMGPVASSNWVANEARAPVVARMDADDISHPRRFELQMQALAAYPDAAMVGTLYDLIDDRGRHLRDADISFLMRGKFVPFAHPTVMYRKEVFERAGGYREGTDYFEDTDLIRRLLKQGNILVLGERLLSQRKWVNSARLVNTNEATEHALIAASEALDAPVWPDPDNHRIAPGNLRATLDHALSRVLRPRDSCRSPATCAYPR
jgi:glycosyltransferase involved in cell wall biosynthesis